MRGLAAAARARPDFRAPLAGKVPVLILSGEFDPVTPPRYGDEVLKTLPNGRHLVRARPGPQRAAGRLHAEAVRALRRHRRREGARRRCLDTVPYAVPFTGFYGWEP